MPYKVKIKQLVYTCLLFASITYCNTLNAAIGPEAPELIFCPADIEKNIIDGCGRIITWDLPRYTDECDVIAFYGPFDPTMFTEDVNDVGGGTGLYDYTSIPEAISLTGSADGTRDDNTNVDLCIEIPCDGTIVFDWEAIMSDGVDMDGGQFNNDEVAYTINGVETILATGGINTDDGTETISVLGGDVFCFRVKSNNRGYYTNATFSNFSFDNTTLTQTAGPPSGSVFLPGTTTVTYEISDGCHNIVECSFDVILVDEIAPMLVCPNNSMVQIMDPLNCDTTLYWEEPVAFDNCGISCFTQELEASNWTTTNVPATATGTGDFVDDCSLVVSGSDNPAILNTASMTDVCITFACDGVLSFSWLAYMTNGVDNNGGMFNNDEPAIVINGTEVELQSDSNANSDNGSETYDIAAGDVVCFRANSMNRAYYTVLEISNLEFKKEIAVAQIAGPTPDTAPGALDGTPVMPGNHEIIYEATDAYGNVSSCSFTIQVKEFEPDGLICKNVNVSLNEQCMTELTVDMVLANETIGCVDHYVVSVWDEDGDDIGNIIDDRFLGQTLNYMVCLPVSNLCCWGEIVIEDKFAPVLEECDDIFESHCNGLINIEKPTAIENCSYWEVILISEETETLPCDPDYTTIVTREYIAVDEAGNQSLPCTQTIYLERLIITDIDFPTEETVSCNDNFATTDEGYPHPSVTGYPTFMGDPLRPGVPSVLCNTLVTFSDELIITTDCAFKILRTWEVREWWCTSELVFGGAQFIKIEDEVGPNFGIPDDMSATTSYECKAQVQLPSVQATDGCSQISGYMVEYEGGVLNSNGGVVELPIGNNRVIYTVFDDCYNSTKDTMYVTVADKTQPVAICEQNTVISVPHSGWVEVLAEVFDDGSWDDCGIHGYEVRRMDSYCKDQDTIWGPTVEYCCDDIANDNIMVALRVTDYNNNVNTCMVNVEIQDKVNPQITCPPDVTIYCTDNYDLDNLSLTFGEASITDNCENNEPIDIVESELDNCGNGEIYRTIEVTDAAGVVVNCRQKITIINNTVFTNNDIDWPEDYDAYDECTADNLDPEDLVYPYNNPVYLDDECNLLGENYEDELFEYVDGTEACIKIIRKWTVINWCKEDVNGDFERYSWEQILKIHNTVDPTIGIACRDTVICSFSADCNPVNVTLLAQAFDDCTPEDLLDWRYEIDYDNDGTIDDDGTGNDASDNYPYGEHKIYWTVLDGCGNAAVCDYTFTIRNCKAPTPVCIQGLSVDLVPMDLNGDGSIDTEMAELWASDFNASSFHTCGNDFVISLSADTTDKFVNYDCFDIGINIVQMWVTDVITGAQDYCETFIDVQDNNDESFCPEPAAPRIEGSIFTENDENIAEVQVILDGPEAEYDMTDITGGFTFEDTYMGASYILRPEKNIEHLNGVSTLDLVLIQKHILGLDKLATPYKTIAADINKDEKISSIDLLELRKLILGVYEEFPENTSWRFIDAQHQFIDNDNPWASPFSEVYNIDALSDDMLIDFVGLKVGDVNNTVSTSLSNTSVDQRSNNPLKLTTQEMELEKGKYYTIDLNVVDYNELLGLQFTLELVGVELLDMRSSYFDIDSENIGNIKDGLKTISIHDHTSNSISKGSALITLELLATKNSSLSTAISLNDALINDEAYDAQLQVNDIQLDFDIDKKVVALYGNKPNPWSNQTSIEFELLEDRELTFNFYNTTGRLLYSTKEEFSAGQNSFLITKQDLLAEGMIFYEIKSGALSLKSKMLILK